MPDENAGEGLKRVIGVPGLTLSIINGVIGAGIFALPAIVSVAIGSFAIISYLVCGLLFAAILLCYAEIGSKITSSGGSYTYVEKALGEFPGYIINWMYFFGWSLLSCAALMNLLADSLAVIYPIFLQALPRALLFFVLVLFIILVNVYGARQSVIAVKIVTVAKLLPLLGIIVLGIQLINTDNLRLKSIPSFKTFSDTTLILFFAFSGFETSLGASGEIKNPRRTVPLSIGIGGLVILGIYLLIQIVTQGILGGDMEKYQSAPLAAVADKIIGPAGATILLICAAVSCFGNVMMDVFCTPRALFAGANDGLFPKILGSVHPKFATPHVAVLIYGGLIFLLSISGGFQQLAIMASANILLIYLAVVISTIKLRNNKLSTKEEGFKAPGGMITPLVAIGVIVWLLTGLKKWEILSTLIFILAVVLIYFLSKQLGRKKLNPEQNS